LEAALVSKTEQKYPDWFLWLWGKGFVVGSVIGLVVLVIVLAVAIYLNQRLQGIEERLTYEPSRRYVPPNLDEYAAKDISPESIVLEKTTYVPVYSHVYYRGGRPYLLEATLSIRNTDVSRPVYVRSVTYYDTKGQLVKTHVDRLIGLDPLETIEFVVEERDTTGGSGANFTVEWLATDMINEPIIEAVMVGTTGTQGICFRASGRTLTSFNVAN
jgi:hypothetical protein